MFIMMAALRGLNIKAASRCLIFMATLSYSRLGEFLVFTLISLVSFAVEFPYGDLARQGCFGHHGGPDIARISKF